jgi:hypothetical protein
MTALEDVDELIERYQRALDEFMKGNPKPVQELFSHRDDASLATTPTVLPCAGGMGSPRPRSMPPPCAGTAGPPALRPWQERDGRTCLRRADRALGVQDRRKGGRNPILASGYDDLSTRGWHLEGSASARRSHNYPSASRVGDPEVELPLE